MTVFACFGPISTESLVLFVGFALGIEAIVVSGIAFIISRVFSMETWKILSAGAIILLMFGVISFNLRMEGPSLLTISFGAACVGLLALRGLINLLTRKRKLSESDPYYLKLDI